MHARISVGYNFRDLLNKMSSEDRLRLRSAFPLLEIDENGELETKLHYWDYESKMEIIDLATQGVLLTELEIPFTIKSFKGTFRAPSSDNSRSIHITIPNVGLLSITTVKVLEDACTDLLQEHLSDGWRIVAVCPPNDARRPDYVLGRTPA